MNPFIVTGPERSGTTPVAMALHHMGVCMVTEPNPLWQEPDVHKGMVEHAEEPFMRGIAGLQEKANGGPWGFKMPGLRPPRGPFSDATLIVMKRNPYDCAELIHRCTRVAVPAAETRALEQAYAMSRTLLLPTPHIHTLEHAFSWRTFRTETLPALSWITRIDVTEDMVERIEADFEKRSNAYMRESSILDRPIRGVVETRHGTPGLVRGFVVDPDMPDKVFDVEVRVNGCRVGEKIRCDRPSMECEIAYGVPDKGFEVEMFPGSTLYSDAIEICRLSPLDKEENVKHN